VSHSYDTRASPSYRGGDNAAGATYNRIHFPSPLSCPRSQTPGHVIPVVRFTRKGFMVLVHHAAP